MITVKTVGIAGLGLIGGSFAKAYKENSDVKVLGVDLNNATEIPKDGEYVDLTVTLSIVDAVAQ